MQGSSLCRRTIQPANRRVQCFWSSHTRNLGTCVLKRLAIAPSQLSLAIKESYVFGSNSLWLVEDTDNRPCSNPDIRTLEKRLGPGDYMKGVVATSLLNTSTRKCQRWINDTAFFYVGVNTHIYFKFLSWYNLHKTLKWRGYVNKPLIVRLPQDNQQFENSAFEKLLFPEIVTLHELGDNVTCFQNLVLVPWAYAATPFRCKMENASLKKNCLTCNGKGLTNTDLMSFRKRVLKTCSLSDRHRNLISEHKSILVILRKQYLRHGQDEPSKFQRIWENSEDFIAALNRHYPKVTVKAIHAENLPICEQVKLAHNADLLIAVHGAGLVHLWWMQENGLLFELVPPSQHENAAFQILAKLLGRNIYSSIKVTERGHYVRVSIKGVIEELKTMFP